jgi:hypothetical protein
MARWMQQIRADRARSGLERGTSLIEVITTVLLLGIVLAVVYEGIASLSGAAEGTGIRLQNLDEGRVIMAVATKDVRTATQPDTAAAAFTLAKPAELQFYANLNNPAAAASLVHLYIDGNTQLVETVTPALTSTGQPCTQQPCQYTSGITTRFVGKYVVNNSTTNPLFTYLDVNGNDLDPTHAGLNAAQMLQVRSVRVLLAVSKAHAFNSGTTWMRNTVGLPNVAFQQQT